MCKVALLLACLASVGYGRRLQVPGEKQSDPSAAISSLLLATNPASAFSPNVAAPRVRLHTPVRSTRVALASTDIKDIQNPTPEERIAAARAHFQSKYVKKQDSPSQRILNVPKWKRSARFLARATGTVAAALLLLKGSAYAMAAGSSLPLAAMFSPAGTWAAYESALAAHPLVVKALTSFVGFTAGDYLAQTLVEKVDKYDLARTARLGSFGLLWHGPSSHYFYGFLDNLIPGTELGIVATKVFCDQVLWNPIFGTVFFSYLNVLEGKTFSDLKTKIKQDLFTAVKGSWAFWVPAHFVNFRFIPGDQRVLYINCLQILYNIFLSFIGNKKVDAAPEPKPAA